MIKITQQMKEVIGWLFLLLLILYFWFGVISNIYYCYILKNRGTFTIGETKELIMGAQSSKYISYVYFVDAKKYHAIKIPDKIVVPPVCYYLVYLRENPKIHLLLFDRPITQINFLNQHLSKVEVSEDDISFYSLRDIDVSMKWVNVGHATEVD